MGLFQIILLCSKSPNFLFFLASPRILHIPPQSVACIYILCPLYPPTHRHAHHPLFCVLYGDVLSDLSGVTITVVILTLAFRYRCLSLTLSFLPSHYRGESSTDVTFNIIHSDTSRECITNHPPGCLCVRVHLPVLKSIRVQLHSSSSHRQAI